MEITRCVRDAFSVVGKEGSTEEGDGFIKRLWAEGTVHLNEVARLAKKDADGTLFGIWGLMSDFSRSLRPWEDGFTKGLYLAGVEVEDGADAPDGWVKWTVPSFEYVCARVDAAYQETFSAVLKYIADNDLTLAGAVFDYTSLAENGLQYIYAPIRRLEDGGASI
jgi:predicted transcriptional regulator YdeE